MVGPPVEEGIAADQVCVVAEFAASLGEALGEVFEGREACVDDGLVGQRPQPFGGLEFGGVGRQEEEDETLGRFDLLGRVPAGVVEHQDS